ncbi:MAG: hypothetical protein KF774_02335 [Planctomyces sp.]|nr:hypothetical protein [Planctomyces sp.]
MSDATDRPGPNPAPDAPSVPGTPLEGAAPPASNAPPAPPPDETQPPQDELPEYEPLTPELVEEEAIRGDIVLRGAVVLLALLLGWTHLADSSVLVKVRTGEYLTSHGILPPRTDVFSNSATNHPWVNLSWAGDIVLSVLHSLGGDRMLTVWAAVVAALAFWLLGRTSRPGAPTWWSSIAGGAALVAAFPWLAAGPDVLTILGLAWLLRTLQRAVQQGDPRLMLRLGIGFFLWSNVDPRAWIGLAIVWLFALGHWLRQGETAGAGILPRSLAMAAGAATIAALIHPFHWHVLKSPYVQFAIEYPEIATYTGLGPHFPWMWQPMSGAPFWSLLDVHAIVGLSLAGVALLALLLNVRQFHAGWALLWLFVNGLAAARGHLLPAAAIVNAVIAGLNAQAWYARTFRQTYSIAWTELLFSRGGRAVTVFGMFGLAYLMLNGALTGPAGRRLGMGLDWRLRTAVSSYAKLIDGTFDDRPFNGRVEHGDILIWLGQKPFVDSRLAMYAQGPENLLDVHRDTYFAFMPASESNPRAGRPDVWRKTFDDYQLTRLLVRLTGEDPGKYDLLLRFLMNPELRLTRIQAAAAEMCRFDAGAGPELRAYVDQQPGTRFLTQAFRGADVAPPEGLAIWPRELTTYEKWLIQPEPWLPESGQLAMHYAFLSSALPQQLANPQAASEAGIALRMLAIREARRALRDDPNLARIHHLIALTCYSMLSQERAFFAQLGQNYSSDLRTAEILAAFNAALMTAANKAVLHEELAQYLVSLNYRDVAFQHLKELNRQTGRWTALLPSDPNYAAARDANRQLYRQLNEDLPKIAEQVREQLDKGADPVAVAQAAMQAGCPELALQTINDHETDLVQNPVASLVQAQLMMAVGRTEEAWERLEGMAAYVQSGTELDSVWRVTTAYANVANGNYSRTVELFSQELDELAVSRLRSLLDGSPLISGVPLKQQLFAASRARSALEALYSFPDQQSLLLFQRALIELQQGRLSRARADLSEALSAAPDSAFRPLIVYYHYLQTGESLPIEGPGVQIPIWSGMFADDPVSDESTEAATPDAESPQESPGDPPAEAPAEESPSAESVEEPPPESALPDAAPPADAERPDSSAAPSPAESQ